MGRGRRRGSRVPYTLFFDGACRGNPGPGGFGFLIYSPDGSVVEEFSACLGSYHVTNNIAEYKALIAGLQHALSLGITHIKAFGDSELVCNQVKGKYIVKKWWLKRYYSRVQELVRGFQIFQVQPIPREENNDADSLATIGLRMDETSVDRSPAAEREILKRCSDPEDAKQYITEQICEGCHKMQYILDTIQYCLPASYDAVQTLGPV